MHIFQSDHFDNISQWYPALSEHTFETAFLEISLEEANAILSYRGRAREIATLYQFVINEPKEVEKVKLMEPYNMISEAERSCLQLIEKNLDAVIRKFGPNGTFVRMDSRSPKDAVLNSKIVKNFIKNELDIRPHDDVYSDACVIDDSIAYWRSISKGQCVYSGKEAMDLLLHSNRISDDITRAKLVQAENFHTKLVVRKWVDIDPEIEFRTFVSKGEMTAITQYHKKCYIPTLLQNKDLIQDLILKKWNQLKDLVVAPEDTYTIDFALDNNFEKIWMVEVNDPPPVAGTSLFDWTNEEDRKILSSGPLTFRVLKEPVPWVEQDDIYGNLKEYIDELRGRRKIEREEINTLKKEDKCLVQ